MSFNADLIRRQFPILECKVHGKPLVYFDSAATALKPMTVVDRINEHYLYEASNVHRGLHFLSDQATQYFEDSRARVAGFINASAVNEVVFTAGTTASVNFVSQAFGRALLKKNDEVLVSEIEHHSNFVPWQKVAQQTGSKFEVFEINKDGSFNLENFLNKLNSNTKIVSVSHVSNTLGTVFPVKEIIKHAKKIGAFVFVDGAQAVPHQSVDVKDLDCDFYAFSGHKLYGPTGIGVLYIKSNLQDKMEPYQMGGGMVDKVEQAITTYQDAPYKFEAGTPHIAGAVGLAAAIEFVNEIGIDSISEKEQELLVYATKIISEIPSVKQIGTAPGKGPILSFVIEGTHPSDVATLLDQEGIAVRAGHHCTQPLMKKYGIPGTVRASFSMYNTTDEMDYFGKTLKKIVGILKD